MPAEALVTDLYWHASNAVEQRGHPYTRGVLATLDWAAGDCPAPITHRSAQPVTDPIARAEEFAALCAQDDPNDPVPFPLEYAHVVDCGVSYAPIQYREPVYVRGVWWTVRWLRGERDIDPPLPIPPRPPVV
ncbi:MAG: hypothetical protein DLM61_03230 [Pseudonocardiales bacterium]|nr:MAG: hypothetical protein DLM61_03230 [Pseudonocardiales bacterium]